MPKQLKASVKLDTKDAIASLKKLEQKINAVNRAVNKQATTSTKLDKSIEKASRTANKLHQANLRAAKSAGMIHKNYQKSGTAVSYLTKKVGMLAKTYLGIMGAKAAMTVSDNVTKARNQLNNLPGGSPERTQATMDKVYAAAMRSRSDYSSMLSDTGKLMTLASGAFQNNEDNAIRFQEIMNKSYALGNMSAAEQASSMYQLTQALGSGVLQGDELRSVREGAALAYQKIEQFAQGIYGADKSLKDLASEGKITSDIVVAAIMNAEESINTAFNNTNRTFADLGKAIKSNATKAFEPVGTALNEALNADAFVTIVNTLGVVFNSLSTAVLFTFDIVQKLFNFVADGAVFIVRSIMTIAAVMCTVMLGALILNIMTATGLIKKFIILKWEAIKSALASAASWLTLCWPLTIILAILAALVIAVIWVADSFVDGCGIIVGVLAVAGAFILNLVIGTINAMIQAIFSLFVDPMMGIIEWFVNAFSGGFDGILGAAANAIGQMVSIVLGGLKLITQAIDAVAGTNLTGKVSGWQTSVKSWGKTETAVTHSVEAPKIKRIDYSNAYSAGYGAGTSAGEWLGDKFNGLTNKLGLTGVDLPNPYDSAYDVTGAYDPTKALKGIEGNTDKIADSMDLTAEDLEYLRKTAEMEWKKEFTTANIVVDMTNNNTVNGDGDLDGIVTRLADKLYEEMDYLANGVYAY